MPLSQTEGQAMVEQEVAACLHELVSKVVDDNTAHALFTQAAIKAHAFVTRPTAAAMAARDGVDPSSRTSRACAGTTSFHGGAIGPMSHFFNGAGDTFDDATDQDVWNEETASGQYDGTWEFSEHAVQGAPADAGSMCPVEEGGQHISSNKRVKTL